MRNRITEWSPSTWLVRVIGAAVAIGAFQSSNVFAQAGYYLTPSLNLTESYDDNIFSTPQNLRQPTPVPTPGATPSAATTPAPRANKTDDFVFRADPGIEGGYQSEPFTLLAGYKFGTDVYAKNSDLNAAPARQAATLNGSYLPDPLLTFAVSGGYFESNQARDLNAPVTSTTSPATGLPVTALESARSRAEVYSAAPSATYLFTPLTTLNGGYNFSHTHELGAASGDSHSARAAVTRDVTENDKVDLAYTFRYFSFEQGGLTSPAAQPNPQGSPTPVPTPVPTTFRSEESSHAVTLGWARQLTELTRIELRGGPRFREGSVDPEAQAVLARRLERGEANFSYERTQTASVGLVGALEAETFSGGVRYDVLENLSTSLTLGLFRSSQNTETADVYTANLAARYRLLEWLSLIGTYTFSYQKGLVGTTTVASGNNNERFYHNIVTVGIEATEPFRVY